MSSSLLLLVDDNSDDEALTRRALRRVEGLSVDVVVARDGLEALALLLGNDPARTLPRRPSLVLLDLKMPRMSGLDLLAAIRSRPETRELPVVVFTSSNEDRDRQSSYELGANAFVSKPVEYLAFSEAVAALARFWLGVNEPPETGELRAHQLGRDD